MVEHRQKHKLEAVEFVCEKLANRSATLFLGAGINYGLKNGDGLLFPMGQGLSDLIAVNLLKENDYRGPLDDVSEIAKTKIGDRAVNEYIFNLLESFDPGPAQIALAQLPWDVIYTTNYDRLVEKAATLNSIEPAGRICPIFSSKADLGDFSDEDILYYKLHGSVEVANTDDGRFILTKEDFRYYEKHRRRLFTRLERDLSKKTFVFIGYSLVDNNLRAILEDCRLEIGAKGLPLSYSVRPHFKDIEETFFKDKYNIQLIDCEGAEFLNLLKESWFAHNRKVIPFELRKERGYHDANDGSNFEKVAESYFRLAPANCGGKSEPKQFFRGAEASWADIRDAVPPRRDLYWTILDALLAELTQPDLPPSAYLLTGAAGTGKSALARSLAFDIAKDAPIPVLVHIPGTPFDAGVLASLINEKVLQRVVILIDHAGENVKSLVNFQIELKRLKLPVTLLLEERKNQWLVSTANIGSKIANAEFELGPLSTEEICSILDALEKHACLGKLSGMERGYQEDHFVQLAQKELLVALRELTSEGSFDTIIKDEYEKISSDIAKQAYVYVSALGQIDLPVRYATLQHVLGLSWGQLGDEVFTPTTGVLISGEEIGRSRHNADFRLRVRHPIIGSVIFAAAAPDDHTKFDLLNRLIERLDPGHAEDRRLLNAIVSGKELLGTFSSPEFKRAVYDRLSDVLPDDPFVFQHRSILERDLENQQDALKYARQAANLNPNHPGIQNSLGLALELSARLAKDNEQVMRKGWIAEASKIFTDGTKRNRKDPFNYLGSALILRQQSEQEADEEKRAVLKARALSLLEEALEETGRSPVIVGQLGIQWKQLGNTEQAIAIIAQALKREPTESRLRELLITILERKGSIKEAYDLAVAGARVDPTFWRMQRHIARLAQKQGHATATVRGHYEAALRHNKSDVSLIVELGAYLFMQGHREDAEKYFIESRGLTLSGSEKSEMRVWWEEPHGSKKIFTGKVSRSSGAVAFALSVPENIEAQFWKTYADMADVKVGDPITFQIGFNAYGPTARIQLGRKKLGPLTAAVRKNA